MAEREDSGRQARPVVFLDDREQPQTLHDVARIMLECQDRSLDGDEITGDVPQEEPELRAVTLTITTVDPDSLIEDLKSYGYNPLEVEVDKLWDAYADERGRAEEAISELEATDDALPHEVLMKAFNAMRSCKKLHEQGIDGFGELHDRIHQLLMQGGTP